MLFRFPSPNQLVSVADRDRINSVLYWFQSLSREELNNNAVILTLAGSETTATSLSGATYLIATHPRVKAEIVNELRTTFTREDEIDLLNVLKLPYLCAVTEECLRMYPPGPNAQPRITPPEGNVILGDRIPGNVSRTTLLGRYSSRQKMK